MPVKFYHVETCVTAPHDQISISAADNVECVMLTVKEENGRVVSIDLSPDKADAFATALNQAATLIRGTVKEPTRQERKAALYTINPKVADLTRQISRMVDLLQDIRQVLDHEELDARLNALLDEEFSL